MQLIDGYMDLHKRAVHMNLTALDFGPHKLTSIVVMHLTIVLLSPLCCNYPNLELEVFI